MLYFFLKKSSQKSKIYIHHVFKFYKKNLSIYSCKTLCCSFSASSHTTHLVYIYIQLLSWSIMMRSDTQPQLSKPSTYIKLHIKIWYGNAPLQILAGYTHTHILAPLTALVFRTQTLKYRVKLKLHLDIPMLSTYISLYPSLFSLF